MNLPDTAAHSLAFLFPEDPALAAAEDRTELFAKMSRENPLSQEAKEAFIGNRLQIMNSFPGLTSAQREESRAALLGSLGESAGAKAQPTPGGVGYGTFYTEAFRQRFNLGARLLFQYFCPNAAGGNVNTWLYLTATNRTSLGVEALVSYYGQNNPTFMVFDWARSAVDPWQINISFAKLGDYLGQMTTHGLTLQVLTVLNMTVQASPGRWRNSVSLLNFKRPGYDLIYSYEYDATEQVQKTGWIGSWGPIVETFQDAYANTNPMGVWKVFLNGQDQSGAWSPLNNLSSGDSSIREDGKGFKLVFIDPNYSWAVKS